MYSNDIIHNIVVSSEGLKNAWKERHGGRLCTDLMDQKSLSMIGPWTKLRLLSVLSLFLSLIGWGPDWKLT